MIRFLSNWVINDNLKSNDLYETIQFKFLPDIYNSNLTKTDYHGRSHSEIDTLSIHSNYFNNLLTGSKRSQKSKTGKFYNTGGTNEFKRDLKTNLFNERDIKYIDEHKTGITTKMNMVEKAKQLVINNNVIERIHQLNEYIQIQFLYDHELVKSCSKLIEKEDVTSITYLLFLLILVSIFQDEIVDFYPYYSEKKTNKILSGISDEHAQIINESLNSSEFTPLKDRHYCHKYHVYLYKNTSNIKFKSATLEFIKEKNDTLSSVFTLSDHITRDNEPIVKQYKGVPIVSQIVSAKKNGGFNTGSENRIIRVSVLSF